MSPFWGDDGLRCPECGVLTRRYLPKDNPSLQDGAKHLIFSPCRSCADFCASFSQQSGIPRRCEREEELEKSLFSLENGGR
jgi:hypothetical protein